jgi:hypothetical protein
MSSVFLLGAGASKGSGPCDPEPPPLGGELFGELRKGGPVASTFSDDLARTFENFEAGMAVLIDDPNSRDLTPLLRQMGYYFARFSPKPGNRYIELVTMLKRLRAQPIFVSLNYDLLLELALQKTNSDYGYKSPATISAGSICVLKIHGSCNFLLKTGSHRFRGTNAAFDLKGLQGAIFKGPIDVTHSPADIPKFLDTQTMLAPAMAMYAKGKRVLYCPEFIEEQKEAWIQVSKGTKRIIIIGVAVNEDDDHIWGTLADSTAPLYYVGGRKADGDTFIAWAKRKNRRNIHVIADSFKAALPKIAGVLSR